MDSIITAPPSELVPCQYVGHMPLTCPKVDRLQVISELRRVFTNVGGAAHAQLPVCIGSPAHHAHIAPNCTSVKPARRYSANPRDTRCRKQGRVNPGDAAHADFQILGCIRTRTHLRPVAGFFAVPLVVQTHSPKTACMHLLHRRDGYATPRRAPHQPPASTASLQGPDKEPRRRSDLQRSNQRL